MARNHGYRQPAESPVDWRETKYDGFTIESTGQEYRHQKGSGRAVVFDKIKPGMKIRDWTKACAKAGFKPDFVIGSLLKHQEGKTAAFRMSEKDDQGRTLAEVKKIRDEDPEKKAAREAKKAEKEAEKARKKEEKMKAAEAKKAEKAAEAKKAKATKQSKAKETQAA